MTKIHYLFCAFFISVGVYAVGLNTTALLDMQSAMARYFHFGDVGARWLVNSYMLAVTSTILAAGKLCDFFNKKRVFLFGGASFVIASVVLALSFHPLLMFIGRVWQGLSVSIAIPSSIAVLKAYIPEKWRIGAFGLWSALMGLGFATGPVLGDVVTQFWGWQFVFLISAVIALISVIASVFLISIVKEQIVNRHFD